MGWTEVIISPDGLPSRDERSNARAHGIDERSHRVMVKNSPTHQEAGGEINLLPFSGNGLSRLIRPSQKEN